MLYALHTLALFYIAIWSYENDNSNVEYKGVAHMVPQIHVLNYLKEITLVLFRIT